MLRGVQFESPSEFEFLSIYLPWCGQHPQIVLSFATAEHRPTSVVLLYALIRHSLRPVVRGDSVRKFTNRVGIIGIKTLNPILNSYNIYLSTISPRSYGIYCYLIVNFFLQ